MDVVSLCTGRLVHCPAVTFESQRRCVFAVMLGQAHAGSGSTRKSEAAAGFPQLLAWPAGTVAGTVARGTSCP